MTGAHNARDDLAALIYGRTVPLSPSNIGEIYARTEAYARADAILAAGWRAPNPCDHSGRAVLAPQHQSVPPSFWCQRCGESGLTYPNGYTYPDNQPRQEIPQ